MKFFFHDIKIFLSLLGNKAKFIPILILLFLSSSVLDLIGLGLIGPYISLVIEPNNMVSSKLIESFSSITQIEKRENLIFSISLLLVIIFFLKFIFNILIQREILKFSFGIQVKIVTELMTIYQQLPYLDFIENNASKYIQTLLNYTGAYGATLTSVLRFFSEAIILIVISTFLLFYFGSSLLILLLFYGGLFFIWHKFSSPRQKNFGKEANEATIDIIQGLNESLDGYKNIKILGNFNFFKNKVIKGINKATQNQRKSQILHLIPSYLMDFILILSIVSIVIIMLISSNDLQNTASFLGVFSVAALRLKPSITIIATSLSTIMVSRFAVKNLYQDYSYLKTIQFEKEQPSDLENDFKFENIKLSNVYFSYPSAKKTNLKKINIEIKKGESIGIIGPSGSGKSTLVDLVVGLLKPSFGKIFINNSIINYPDNYKFQRQVAYLPQETFLIDGSIKKNITFLNENEKIDNIKLTSSIKKSKLYDFIKELPEGSETRVGDRGVKLSGGQKQRISLARAFYHERKILILDEATSALDSKTEEEIVDEIKELKGSTTMVIISHRNSTVKHCDRIYVLENGIIKRTGTPENILTTYEK